MPPWSAAIVTVAPSLDAVTPATPEAPRPEVANPTSAETYVPPSVGVAPDGVVPLIAKTRVCARLAAVFSDIPPASRRILIRFSAPVPAPSPNKIVTLPSSPPMEVVTLIVKLVL